jgi:hypothetical protein
MPWTAVPTFTSGDVLTAYNLNILSNNLEHLHGFVSGANPAMTSVSLAVDGDCFFIIRHLHRYLRVLYKANDDVKIYYDAAEVFHDGDPEGTPESTYIDLYPSGVNTHSLVVGQLYTIKCSLDSDAADRIIYFLYESDTNT